MNQAKPNLVIIMADEIRQDVVMHNYARNVPLPHVDELRRDGVTFADCFCQTPTCCPSRGSLATGKYPHQLQLWNHGCRLPPEERTLGHHFSGLGYESVAFGKTHNMCPGFRSVTYDVKATMGSTNHGYNITDDNCVGVFAGPEEDFCDFVVCRQFDDFLGGRSAGQPFLAHIGIHAPHPPLYPPRRFAEMFDWRGIDLPPVWEEEARTKPAKQQAPRARWHALSDTGRRKVIATALGMSALVDECVGRIVKSLGDRGLLEDTLLVFTSDHGDLLGAHGMLGKFLNHYEESLRVPLILRLPGRAHAGAAPAGLTELVDVYPTLCDLAGVPWPEAPNTLAGRSLAPLIDGTGEHPREYVFSQIEHASMVRTDAWKLVHHTDDRCELYHLAADPGERQNLFGSPGTREIERDLLLKMMQTLGTHRREGFNPGSNGFFG